jgi:hypothetical protein
VQLGRGGGEPGDLLAQLLGGEVCAAEEAQPARVRDGGGELGRRRPARERRKHDLRLGEHHGI